MEKETKQCSRCKEVKEFALFSKRSSSPYPHLRPQCKGCDAKDVKDNKERHTASIKRNYEENKERILAKKAEYTKAFPEVRKETLRKSYDKNKHKYREEHNKRMQEDSFYAFKVRITKRINVSVRNGYTKDSSVYSILGCSHAEFKSYIESKFSKGMEWGKIHLDHIEPLHRAKNEEEFLILCHYTNVQPLFPIDNLKKGRNFDDKKTRLPK